jgi:hypothetical protein
MINIQSGNFCRALSPRHLWFDRSLHDRPEQGRFLEILPEVVTLAVHLTVSGDGSLLLTRSILISPHY